MLGSEGFARWLVGARGRRNNVLASPLNAKKYELPENWVTMFEWIALFLGLQKRYMMTFRSWSPVNQISFIHFFSSISFRLWCYLFTLKIDVLVAPLRTPQICCWRDILFEACLQANESHQQCPPQDTQHKYTRIHHKHLYQRRLVQQLLTRVCF